MMKFKRNGFSYILKAKISFFSKDYNKQRK